MVSCRLLAFAGTESWRHPAREFVQVLEFSKADEGGEKEKDWLTKLFWGDCVFFVTFGSAW